MSTRSKLEFAVRFAQDIDLQKLRQGDLINLREDINFFLGLQHLTPLAMIKDIGADTYFGLKKGDVFPIQLGGEGYWLIRKEDEPVFSIPIGESFPHQLTIDDLRSLQENALELLKTATENSEILVKEAFPSYSKKSGKSINIIEDKIGFDITVIKRLFWAGKKKHSYVHMGKTHDLFLAHLAVLLTETNPDLIRKCPQCGKIFYRVRKQQYCSRTCTNKVLFQRYLDKHGDRPLKISLGKSKSKGGIKRKQSLKK